MNQWQPQQDPGERRPPATPPQFRQDGQDGQYSQYGPQSQQPQHTPQPPQAPRQSRKGLAFLGCGGLGALAVLIAILAGAGGSSPSPAPAAAAASPSAAPSAAAACAARKPAYGDLVVRDSDPGASVMAQEVGGAYVWDHVTGKCLDAVSWLAATAGQAPGECTTIAKAADNPGYDASAVPAPPLKDVIQSAGPGC